MPKNSDFKPLACMNLQSGYNTDSERLPIGVLFDARFRRVLETVVEYYEAEQSKISNDF